MRYIFVAILAVLLVASIATWKMLPEASSDVPVIYWVTDNNPARKEQVDKFHGWLVKNRPKVVAWLKKRDEERAARGEPRKDYEIPEDPSKPVCELRVDTANRDTYKQIIQGVSGVGGDTMDIFSSGGDMLYFCEVGLLEDVTDAARELGFDTSQTWSAMVPELTLVDEQGRRRQYMFPCNCTATQFWVNLTTFRKHGQEPPPTRWSFEEFERRGKAFVEAANKGKPYRDVFFASGVDTTPMHRSVGLSRFNETLTACALDDPRYAQVLELKRKWTYDDHIIPTPSDVASFSSDSGYGGLTIQLFNNGNYAMFKMGRYALIQLRKFGAMELAVSEPPHGGFPNLFTGTRAAAVYRGGDHKDLAVLFLAFLASEDYNMQIVEDADALPPNPKYTEGPAYSDPPKYPNEKGCHDVFKNGMEEIAVGNVFSPFVSPRTVQRLAVKHEEAYMSNLISAEEAARVTAEQVNAEIERTLSEDPKLRPRYEKALEKQKRIDAMVALWEEIDAMRSEGKTPPAELLARARKIPLADLDNVFHQRYYRWKGWAE